MTPFDPRQWDVFHAAHLLNRAGFGGSPGEIETFYRLGFDAALARVLTWQHEPRDYPVPTYEPKPSLFQMTAGDPFLGVTPETARLKADKVDQYQQLGLVKNWWLNRMRNTANPLWEKMTLFWHGHFATGMNKVEDSFFMWQQNEMLRHYALGNFGDLVRAISRDPAMMIYLDLRYSSRTKPNENFARELMELFTLGIGHYTEDDVKQAARAFTGYRISGVDKIGFQFVPAQYDAGVKKFLGREGAFGGDDVIGIILDQPACAEFITRKLWRFFAGPEPSEETVQALAGVFRGAHYEIEPVLRAIFASAEFYGPGVREKLIKSPVQWTVQTAKSLELQLAPDGRIAGEISAMGQTLFFPPNVKGWDGGKAWINTDTLLRRYNFAPFFLRPNTTPYSVDFLRLAPPAMRTDRPALVASAAFRLFQRPLNREEFAAYLSYLEQVPRMDDGAIRGLYHLMMSTPQYQLC